MKNILSIDGGGIRGIIPLKVLEYIEQQTGKQIQELFHVIGGTSTGGIIALGLNSTLPGKTTKYTATDLLKFYTEDAGKIFSEPEPKKDSQLEETVKADDQLGDSGWWHPTYSSAGIEKYLQDKFGLDTKMSNLSSKPDVTVFSYDIQNDCPYYFNSKDDYCVWQAARATSAAPTFFPAANFSTKSSDKPPKPNLPIFVDGGVYINNPALALLIHAQDLYPNNEEEFLLISLGTGRLKTSRAYLEKAGVIPWMAGGLPKPFQDRHRSGALLEVMMNGSSETIHQQLEKLKSHDSASGLKIPSLNLYQRYQKEFTENIAMDDINSDTITKLVNLGKALVNEKKNELNELCKALVKIK